MHRVMSDKETKDDNECQACHGTGSVGGVRLVKSGPFLLTAGLSGMRRHRTQAEIEKRLKIRRLEALATVGYLQSERFRIKAPTFGVDNLVVFVASRLLFNRSVGPLIARAKSKHPNAKNNQAPAAKNALTSWRPLRLAINASKAKAMTATIANPSSVGPVTHDMACHVSRCPEFYEPDRIAFSTMPRAGASHYS